MMDYIYDKKLDKVMSGEVVYNENAIYSEILMMLFENPLNTLSHGHINVMHR